jgi:tRNA (guanine10-N2)-dimethyltransferase
MLKRIYYARLSGLHPTLPLSELLAIGEAEGLQLNIIERFDLIVLFKIDSNAFYKLFKRTAYTKSAGILLSVSEPNSLRSSIKDWIPSLKDLGVKKVGITFERIRGVLREIRGNDIINMISRELRKNGISVDMHSAEKLEIFLVEGLILAGLRLFRIDINKFEQRRPRRRPFFKPGPLDPRLSRVFVNLSRLKKGDVFLDPFCGTGGMAIEACDIGASKVLCGDIDKSMAQGSYINLKHYGCSGRFLSLACDATKLPLSENYIDAIATDPPYGRSTTTKGRELKNLYKSFLKEARSILKKSSYLVFAGPLALRPDELAFDEGFNVVERHFMYVHGSLIRVIVVAKT